MSKYQKQLELFVENIPVARKVFKWQESSKVFLSSLILTSKGIHADEAVLKETRKMYDKNTSIFSNLKYNSATTITTLLSETENPAEVLKNINEVQTLLKEQKFYKDDYTALVATQIVLNTPENEYEKIAVLTGEFYQAMKEKHRWMTDSSDYMYACQFAMLGLNVKDTISKMDELMEELMPHFKWTPNSSQTLAQMLVLGDVASENSTSASQKIEQILKLQEMFKSKNLKVGSEFVAILGLIVMLPISLEEIVDQIVDCCEELKAEKEFGKYNAKQITFMFASSIVIMALANDMQKETSNSVMANIITNLIMQQQMMMAILLATVTISSIPTNN
ncbi:MAG: DUF4003 domain-containing protein [Clostridioides sp.]|jgi:hypothetical protein|nr:DUF4003 domain-containing protein [Clostridioides sp.]